MYEVLLLTHLMHVPAWNKHDIIVYLFIIIYYFLSYYCLSQTQTVLVVSDCSQEYVLEDCLYRGKIILGVVP